MQQSEASISYPGWRVVLASLAGLAVSPGPLLFGSIGILAGAFEAQYDWGRGAIMLSLTIFNLSTIIAAPFVGRLIDKLGARRILIASIILFGLALAVPYFGLASLFHFYVIVFIAGAVSPGAQSMPYTRLIASWFDRNRGLAIGIAASGLGVGYAVIPPLVDAAVGAYGWRSTFAILGGAVFAIPLTFVLLFARPKPGLEAGAGNQALYGVTAREAAGKPSFWIIASAVMIFSCLLTGFVPHIVPLLKGLGVTGADAAKIASAFGVTTFLGRLLAGFLLDRFFAPRVAIAFFSISLIGLALLLVAETQTIMLIAVMLVGVGFGAESDLIGYFVSRYFGLKAFGQIYGYILSAFIIGAAIGPIILGYGFDYMGGYNEVLIAFIALGLVGLVILSRLGPYSYAPENAAPAET